MTKITGFICAALMCLSLGLHAQTGDKIKWLSLQEALVKNKKEPRKIIMDVYTDWCGWCKHMDKTTFADQNIAAYINANYYAVKFDAECNDSIEYKGKMFTNSGSSPRPGRKPTHPLAIEFLKGQMSYPSIVYFDDSSDVITAVPGYRSAKDIQPFLVYFSENLYRYVNLPDFINDFNTTTTDSLRAKTELVKWMTMEEALKKMGTDNKKLFVSLQTSWCITCKMMDNVTFNNKVLADYINTHTYPVRFNATSRDTIEFNKYRFINENKGHPFHQLAVQLLNGNMRFPNFVFINEKGEVLTSVPGYMSSKQIEPIVTYFVTDTFKSQKWEDYQKSFVSKLE